MVVKTHHSKKRNIYICVCLKSQKSSTIQFYNNIK